MLLIDPIGLFSSSSMDAEVDIYELLNQRERDLTLAAEIGQALLEKNEQLSKQNEEIAEEFSKKLEVGRGLLLHSSCSMTTTLSPVLAKPLAK